MFHFRQGVHCRLLPQYQVAVFVEGSEALSKNAEEYSTMSNWDYSIIQTERCNVRCCSCAHMCFICVRKEYFDEISWRKVRPLLKRSCFAECELHEKSKKSWISFTFDVCLCVSECTSLFYLRGILQHQNMVYTYISCTAAVPYFPDNCIFHERRLWACSTRCKQTALYRPQIY